MQHPKRTDKCGIVCVNIVYFMTMSVQPYDGLYNLVTWYQEFIIPYIGNHSRKKSFANELLWHSSRENIRDSTLNLWSVIAVLIMTTVFVQAVVQAVVQACSWSHLPIFYLLMESG